MAMKVYINGDTVEIDQTSQPLLNIPRNKAIYRIENDDVTIFNNEDRTVFRTDKLANIQNQSGTTIGNLQDVVKYLSKSVVVRGTSVTRDATTPGGGGEANTASNVGGGSGVFKQKNGIDLEFKSLIAGTNLTITNNTDDLTLDVTGVGEVNTASNLGAGEGVFAQKTAQDLEFKSLVAGSGISLSSTGTEITVTNSAGAPEQFYLERTETINNTTAVDIEYFTFVQGGTEITNTITVSGGTYYFEISFLAFCTSNNGRIVVNPQVNSTDIFSQPYKRERKDNDEIFYESISKRVALSAGVNTIQLQLSNNGSGSARIFEANVQITKV
jgi:hypothetical protein